MGLARADFDRGSTQRISLMQRANALQLRHHFRYPLSDRVGERLADLRHPSSQRRDNAIAPYDLDFL
jgi:hypothetical protein